MELTALETTFYTLGIVLMSLIVLLMVVSVIMIFYIKHKITLIQNMIEDKITDLTNRPHKVAMDVGASILTKLFNLKK